MKNVNYFLVFLSIIISHISSAQFFENFDDGELLSNPTWIGDLDEFSINQSVLRSNGDTTSLSNREIWISTPSSGINNMLWEFFVDPKVSTSSNNRIDVYLTSNQNQLTGNNNGYFVRIGGTPDEVALFRKDGLGIESYVINGTPQVLNSSSSNPTKVKVMRDALGNWLLYADYTGIGSSYELVGTALDTTYTSSAFFGIVVRYSSSNRQKYFFDGIDVLVQNENNCHNDLTINPISNLTQIGLTASFTAQTSDEIPSYTWQSDFGQGFQTLINIGKYSGVNTQTLNISNIQLSEHNQPIRVISTSGECFDTSDIVYISIVDTCINIINDTTLITVTDTLIINTNIASINPLINSNTIKVFPNPANNHITIDYGNFATMNGYQLKIENSLGQQLFQTNITQQTDYLSLNNWGGNGLYFVHIIDAQGNTIDIRKIVLQ